MSTHAVSDGANAAQNATQSAQNTAATIEYRTLDWNDLDAAVQLFERTWPMRGEQNDTATSLNIAKFFALHYLEPTTEAIAAYTSDGTLAGVAFVRAENRSPQFPQAATERERIEQQLANDSASAKEFASITSMLNQELELEDESSVNATTQGELELFVVNPDIRGCGVGGGLWHRIHAYLAENGASDYYLHTDSSCDVSFYDHKGLECVAKRTSCEDGVYESMFIYRGKVEA